MRRTPSRPHRIPHLGLHPVGHPDRTIEMVDVLVPEHRGYRVYGIDHVDGPIQRRPRLLGSQSYSARCAGGLQRKTVEPVASPPANSAMTIMSLAPCRADLKIRAIRNCPWAQARTTVPPCRAPNVEQLHLPTLSRQSMRLENLPAWNDGLCSCLHPSIPKFGHQQTNQRLRRRTPSRCTGH
jgi:hypothetical protein